MSVTHPDPGPRQPAPGVFRLKLPLPFPGLDHVNAYLLRGDDGCTLVDCGMRTPDPAREHGWGALVDALGECGTSVDDIDRLVMTHPHIDHYGLAAKVVETAGCEVWMHAAAEADLDVYRDPGEIIDRVRTMLADHVAESELEELTAFEDWTEFVWGVVSTTRSLTDGESFSVGGREWTIVYTPGHSAAHVCVFAPADRILISGDHILGKITPHIDFKRGEQSDPLGDFLSSLGRIEALDPALVLPGHGRPFEEGAERARTIARHHDRRIGAIVQVIRNDARSASEITQEIFGGTLLHFQRRLALGETLAHLVYLRRRGEIERSRNDDGIFVYRKAARKPVEDDG